MAITKSDHFTADLQQTAEMLKALGHPARLAILQLLAERRSCMCGDITQELPLAQSTVSQHLKALKQAGLIKGEIDGVKVCYCLNESGMEQLRDLAIPFIDKLNYLNNQTCC